MGKSLTYKLFETHSAVIPVKPGIEIPIKIDQVLTPDDDVLVSFLQFESIGIPRIKTNLAVCYIDHNTLQMGVARKYFVITEFIDIFTQACKVCIHDEDVAETDFEHTFETPKGFRSGFGKSCTPPAVGHLEMS